MKIFPAIDIRGGNAVRLYQGDYQNETVYSSSPIEVAADFLRQGAKQLHVVDLDGALDGALTNSALIRQIAGLDMFVEVGGGIRDDAAVEAYLSAGVNRVILGSAAVEDHKFLERTVKRFGSAVAVGVDAKDGFVAVHGWKKITDVNAYSFSESVRDLGVNTVIYTDISRDGTMTSPNFEAYERLSKIEGLDVIASGGVSSLDDLRRLKEVGVYGAILGRALYLGAVSLADAIGLEKD